jgi:hypothetical protein
VTAAALGFPVFSLILSHYVLVVSPRMVDQPCFPAHTRSLLVFFTMKKLSREGPEKDRQLNIRTGKFLVRGHCQECHSVIPVTSREYRMSLFQIISDFRISWNLPLLDSGKNLPKADVFPARKSKSS